MPSKAEIRKTFRNQLESLAVTGQNIDQASQLRDQRRWTEINKGDWDGDLSKISDLGKPFSREENANDTRDAIRDVNSPGAIGDLMVSQLQGDYLALMERAFRARHQSEVRSQFHAAARRFGHGAPTGVLARGVLGYLEGILKATKNS